MYPLLPLGVVTAFWVLYSSRVAESDAVSISTINRPILLFFALLTLWVQTFWGFTLGHVESFALITREHWVYQRQQQLLLKGACPRVACRVALMRVTNEVVRRTPGSVSCP